MDAKELRIGNLINLTKDNFKTVKPYELEGFDIYKLSESDCVDIQPIPLTEEWLLKFGFDTTSEEYGEISIGGSNELTVWFDGETSVCNRKDGSPEYFTIPTSTKHVHQLQNLYFALTGEELTIKI